MSKVLLTGASGFIGSHLAKALVARGDDVACLVRRSSSLVQLDPLGVRYVRGDLSDSDSLRNAIAGKEIIYHLAGCTKALDSRQFYRVNAGGVRNLMQACSRQAVPPVVVCVSSLAAAGPSPPGRARTESDRPAPVSHYGRSKRLGEREAQRLADRVPVSIIRPPIVFGEYDQASLGMFWSVSRFRTHMIPGLARNRYSLIHAADLAELLILAAERGNRLTPQEENDYHRWRGYYFAACEQTPTYPDLGRMIGVAMGRRRAFAFHVASPIVWIIAGVIESVGRATGQPQCLNLDKAREVTAGSWMCSAQRATDELGFTVGASLPERLKQTVEWYRSEGWL